MQILGLGPPSCEYMKRSNNPPSSASKRIAILAIAALAIWGLGMLAVRLHLTQLAYEFESLKRYERSLKEEEIRLRALLAEKFSLDRLQSDDLVSPQPDQVVRLP